MEQNKKKDWISLNELIDKEICENLQKKEVEYYKLLELAINFFGKIYSIVQWGKIVKGNKFATDIFEHRLFFACNEETIELCLEKLCSTLSIQASQIDPELIMRIREIDNHMDIIRERTRLIMAFSQLYSKKLKQKRLEEKQNEEKQ